MILLGEELHIGRETLVVEATGHQIQKEINNLELIIYFLSLL